MHSSISLITRRRYALPRADLSSTSDTTPRYSLFYTMLAAVALGSAVLGNTISVTSSDVKGGSLGLDSIQATWGKTLDIGDKKADLELEYDRSESSEGLSSVSLSGDLSDDSDLKVSYEVSHSFTDDSTDVTLTAVSSGTTLAAEYDATGGELTELSAQRELEIGGSDVDTTVSWMVEDKKARIKMMTALGDATLTAEVDYKDGDISNLELGYDTNLEDGRDLSISYTDEELEVEVTDTTFEDDATWTATATMKHPELDLDDLKLTLKRSWSW